MEYASNGKGNLGVTLGAIGTGLGVLQNGMGLLGASPIVANSNYATKEELTLMQKIMSKDSEIADLRAESAAESKMIEVYKQTRSEIKELQNEINANRRDQDAWNASQSVINAQMASSITTNTNSIANLQNIVNQITMLKVPNTAVCPGWGPVTVTPSGSGTTIA